MEVAVSGRIFPSKADYSSGLLTQTQRATLAAALALGVGLGKVPSGDVFMAPVPVPGDKWQNHCVMHGGSRYRLAVRCGVMYYTLMLTWHTQ